MRGPQTAQWKQILARLTAAFAVGASFNLGFAPFGWWPIALAAPAALFALIRGLPPRRACAAGAAFGVGLFAFGTYWLYTCLHVFGLVPVWLTLVLQSVLVAAMSLYPAALCYLANRFWLKPGATRDWLVLPALWVLLEWLRGWLLSGFPWLSVGYAMIDSPLAGWAPLFGVYGVTWAAAIVAVAINVALMPAVTLARRADGTCRRGAAVLQCPRCWRTRSGRILQGRRSQLPPCKARCLRIKSGSLKIANLPCSAICASPARRGEPSSSSGRKRRCRYCRSIFPITCSRLKEQGRAHDADFAIGLVDYRPATKQYFNGILVLSAAGDGWYYKRHLVPFGEYFPVPRFRAILAAPHEPAL